MISKYVCVCVYQYTQACIRVLCVLIHVYTCIHFPALFYVYISEAETSQEREAHLGPYTVVSNATSHEKEPELLWELTGKWLGQAREARSQSKNILLCQQVKKSLRKWWSMSQGHRNQFERLYTGHICFEHQNNFSHEALDKNRNLWYTGRW